MPKPSIVPLWSTTAVYTAGPDVGLTTRAAPGGLAAEGWVGGDPASARFMNHLLGYLGDWANWVNDGASSFAQTAHLVETDGTGQAQAFSFESDVTGDTAAVCYAATTDPAATTASAAYSCFADGAAVGFRATTSDGYGVRITSLNETRGHVQMVAYAANPGTIERGAWWTVDGPGTNSRAGYGANGGFAHYVQTTTMGAFGAASMNTGTVQALATGTQSLATVTMSDNDGPAATGDAVIEFSAEIGEVGGVSVGAFDIDVYDNTADPGHASPIFTRAGYVLHTPGPGFSRHFVVRFPTNVPAAGTRTYEIECTTIGGGGTGVQFRDICFSVRPEVC